MSSELFLQNQLSDISVRTRTGHIPQTLIYKAMLKVQRNKKLTSAIFTDFRSFGGILQPKP